jgi:hypothetical protein
VTAEDAVEIGDVVEAAAMRDLRNRQMGVARVAQGVTTWLASAWHARGVANGVADRVDDDLFFRNLVEDEKRIWCSCQTADGRIVGADANIRVSEKQTNDVLDTSLNALSSLG